MDPISIIVTALALGAAAGLKPTAEKAIKDAYDGLKAVIKRKYEQLTPTLAYLEARPERESARNDLLEDLAKTTAAEDVEVLAQAKAVLDVVEQKTPEIAGVIGINLEQIKGANLELTNIIAKGSSSGSTTGVHVKGAELSGDIRISGVTVDNTGTLSAPLLSQPKVTPMRPIKLLFLAANPTDTTHLRLGEEVRAIEQALQLAQYRDRFAIVQHHAVRVTDLQRLLLQHRPDIVHFSGHGELNGELVLEDTNGTTQPVSPEALSTVFSLLKDNIRCVVLNACFSITQASAISQHIDCVIGISTAITDESAIRFVGSFYQALAYGRTLQNAFALGKSQIQLEGLNEQDALQLIAPNGNVADVTLIEIA